MIINNLTEKAARAANPSASSLGGFDIQDELTKALRKAVKPIEPKLRAYVAKRGEIQGKVDRWSPEAFEHKLHEVAQAAHTGDTDAAAELEAGSGPSRDTFRKLHALAWQEMEQHERDGRHLFAEAGELVAQPMSDVVAQGQQILDTTLAGLGVPSFELQGPANAVGYLVGNLQRAGRGESADLGPFWETLG